MLLNRHFFVPALVMVFSLLTNSLASADSEDEARLERRASKIVSLIETIQVSENLKIPSSVMEQAKGIIILRQYEAGFVFGAKGGFGLAMRKQPDGHWGPPAWIKTGEISGGLQIGVQTLSVVLLIMNDKGLKMLDKPKFRVGVDATVTAGPTGSNVQARIGGDIALLAYTDTEGLYAGATFEGGFLLPDKKSNLLAYGEPLSVPEIITNPDLEQPPYADHIIQLLRNIEIGQDTREDE